MVQIECPRVIHPLVWIPHLLSALRDTHAAAAKEDRAIFKAFIAASRLLEEAVPIELRVRQEEEEERMSFRPQRK